MRDRLMYSHGVDKFVIGHRNHLLAKRAWRRCHQFECESKHFRQGFLDGYMDVTWGGNGCLPPTAPRKYWGWRYQNPTGQAEIADWFAGYPMGAAAAQQEGVRTWGQVGSYQEGDACLDCHDSELGEHPNGYLPGMSPPGVPLEELPPEHGQRLDESPSNLPRPTIPNFEPMPDQSATHKPSEPLGTASQAGLSVSDSDEPSQSDMFVLLSDLPPVDEEPAPERRLPLKKPMVIAEEQGK